MPDTMEIEEIGEMDEESEEAGIPVFQIRTSADSYMNFAFLESQEGLTVYDVNSNRYGDFKRMMNRVIDQFQSGEDTHVTFMNVISDMLTGKDLHRVLQGFDEDHWEAREGPHEGQEYKVLEGVWERNRK